MDEQKKKKKKRDRRAVKKIEIIGPAVSIGGVVVAGGINQEFYLKAVSAKAIADAQRECVLFSSKLLSLIAQNGETEEPPVEGFLPEKVKFPTFQTDADGTVHEVPEGGEPNS